MQASAIIVILNDGFLVIGLLPFWHVHTDRLLTISSWKSYRKPTFFCEFPNPEMSAEKPLLVGPERLLSRSGGSNSIPGVDTSEERKAKLRLLAMAPYERHKLFVNTYMLTRPGDSKQFERDTSNDKTPFDVLQEQHRFVWTAKDSEDSWEARLAKRYYDLLYREYAICDLSRYKAGLVAMRWQTQKEVESGKGQFICGNKVCQESAQLRTWEVPFSYEELGEKRMELVKLRLCRDCSALLNFKQKRREVTKVSKSGKKAAKRKRKHGGKEDDSTAGEEEDDAEKEDLAEKKRKEEEEAATKKAEEEEVKVQAEAIWGGPAPVTEEEGKTREDEFQSYLEDLFL